MSDRTQPDQRTKLVDVKAEAHKIAHEDAPSAIKDLHIDLSKMSFQERKELYKAIQGELKDNKGVLPGLSLSDDRHGHKHISLTKDGKTQDFDINNRRERVSAATPEAAAAIGNGAPGKPLQGAGDGVGVRAGVRARNGAVQPAETSIRPGEARAANAVATDAVQDVKHGRPNSKVTDKDGTTRKYNDQGQLVEESRGGGNDKSTDITRWDAKNPNYEKPTYQYHRDGNGSTETQTKYGADGNIQLQKIRNVDPDHIENTTIDGKGDKTVETTRFSDGLKTTSKVDDKGEYYHKEEKLDGSYTERSTDRLSGNTSTTKYDGNTGQRDLIVKHDETGETVNESHTSPADMLPHINEPKLPVTPPMEHPIAEQQKGPAGQTVESEDHRTSRRYDSQGRLVEEQRVDDRGNLTDKRVYDAKNPDYSKPTYEFHEDQAGRSETRTTYDASGAAVRTESKTFDKNDNSSHSNVTENGKVVSDITTNRNGWTRQAVDGDGNTETITHSNSDGRTVSTKSSDARGEYYHREQLADGSYKETAVDKDTGNTTVDSYDAKTKTKHTVVTTPTSGLVSDSLTVPNSRGGTETTIKDSKGEIYHKSRDRDGDFTETKLDRSTGNTTHVISSRGGTDVSTRIEDANKQELSNVENIVDRDGVTHTFKSDAKGRQYYRKDQQTNGTYREQTDDFRDGTRTVVNYDGPTGHTTTAIQDRDFNVTSSTEEPRPPYVAPPPEKPVEVVTAEKASVADMWRQFTDIAKQQPDRTFEAFDGRHYKWIPLDKGGGRLVNMDV